MSRWSFTKALAKLFTPKVKCLKCPNCKGNSWIEGPGGGSFGNIECAKCHKKYNNLGPFGLQEIT